MSESAVVLPSPKKTKKELRRTIREKLIHSLADYRSIVGEKKFESRIRKAARMLGEDIVKATPKKAKVKVLKEKSS
jgi:hypothetical protein